MEDTEEQRLGPVDKKLTVWWGRHTHIQWQHKLDSGQCHHGDLFTHSFITVNYSISNCLVLTWHQALCQEWRYVNEEEVAALNLNLTF